MSRDDGAELRAGTMVPLNYWNDPALADLGSSARDLLLLLASYSADHLTDGAIPARVVRMLATLTDDPEAATTRPIDARLVEVLPDASWRLGPKIADWNLTAAQVAARRAQRREAGRRRAAGAERDPITHAFTKPAQKPADEPAGAGRVASQRRASGKPSERASGKPSERASPSPVLRTPSPVEAKQGVNRSTARAASDAEATDDDERLLDALLSLETNDGANGDVTARRWVASSRPGAAPTRGGEE